MVRTPSLDVECFQFGPPRGPHAVLLHGFPYDAWSYAEVAPRLAAAGLHVVVPHLRGFGATRLRDRAGSVSGQQAALGQDVADLLDALDIGRAVVAGYDWGGRAACVLAALQPDRVAGLVTVGGYNIQDLPSEQEPETPVRERAKWYQHWFQSEAGRRGLERDREEVCAMLWREWSPTWADVDAQFERSRPSVHNPDFVDVVIHSYRHRRGNAPGAPEYEQAEAALARGPQIVVPSVVLAPQDDGLGAVDPLRDRHRFDDLVAARAMVGVGHNPPQEAPAQFAAAVLDVTR